MDIDEIRAAIDRSNGQPVTTTGCAGAPVQREVFQNDGPTDSCG